MKLKLLFFLTVTGIIQVHATLKGLRVEGDYTLHYRRALIGVTDPAGYLIYPLNNTPSRPEIITCLDLVYLTDPTYNVWTVANGVGFTKYKITAERLSRTYIIYAFGKPPKESLTSGDLSRVDSLLHMENFTKLAIPNKIIVVNLKFPKILNPTATITWISVLDVTNNDAGSVRVIQGGVGFKAINLQMKSRVGEGLRFRVQIYGNNFTSEDWPWYQSHNAATEARLFRPYWPWMDEEPREKKNCGCKTGRLMIASP